MLSMPYAECHLCWVSVMLSVSHVECHIYWVSLMLSVAYAVCRVCWVLFMLSVAYAVCRVCWVLLMLSVVHAECRSWWASWRLFLCLVLHNLINVRSLRIHEESLNIKGFMRRSNTIFLTKLSYLIFTFDFICFLVVQHCGRTLASSSQGSWFEIHHCVWHPRKKMSEMSFYLHWRIFKAVRSAKMQVAAA
jgi:hypothetical protein